MILTFSQRTPISGGKSEYTAQLNTDVREIAMPRNNGTSRALPVAGHSDLEIAAMKRKCRKRRLMVTGAVGMSRDRTCRDFGRPLTYIRSPRW
jgi:hypothetical protein